MFSVLVRQALSATRFKGYMCMPLLRTYAAKAKAGPPLISVRDLDLEYSDKTIFHGLGFELFPRSKVTIVGNNGIGKSTFLKLLHQESLEDLDKEIQDWSGAIKVDGTVGYLPQAFNRFDNDLVIEHIVNWSGALELQNFLTNNPLEQNNFNPWLEEFNYLGGHNLWKPLSQLSFGSDIFCRPMSSLSGGQKTKIHLATLAFQNPDIMLLDEPTNHLDIMGMKWLSNYIRKYSGAVVMVTHDRALISETSDRISELSPTSHNFVHFKGGYKKYLEAQSLIAEKVLARAARCKKEKKSLEDELNQALQVREAKTYNSKDNDKIGFKSKGQRKQKQQGNKVVNLKSKIEDIEEELQSLPQTREKLGIQITYEDNGFFQIAATNLTCTIDGRVLFNPTSFSAEPGKKLIITGPNGVGKTSMLRKIEMLGDMIAITGPVRVGYLDQEQEGIDIDVSATEYVKIVSDHRLNETQATNLLYSFGISSYNDLNKPIENLSIGTVRKVQIAGIIASGANVLLLDEPTNHIDLLSMEAIEGQLREFPGVVIATSHDRYFMEALGGASIIELEEYYEN